VENKNHPTSCIGVIDVAILGAMIVVGVLELMVAPKQDLVAKVQRAKRVARANIGGWVNFYSIHFNWVIYGNYY